LDVSRRALELIDRPYRQLIEADLSSDLPESAPQYDCVLALDVIEHIDDDSRALHQLARLAKSPGLVIVSVPALPLPGRRPAQRQDTRESAREEDFGIPGGGLWNSVQPVRSASARRAATGGGNTSGLALTTAFRRH
jgi:SAM-dependent methyltransferase